MPVIGGVRATRNDLRCAKLLASFRRFMHIVSHACVFAPAHWRPLLCPPRPSHKVLRLLEGLLCLVSREAAVVYQMGSYYSLWVTDPYDLEIGSTKATRFSCPRSKAK